MLLRNSVPAEPGCEPDPGAKLVDERLVLDREAVDLHVVIGYD